MSATRIRVAFAPNLLELLLVEDSDDDEMLMLRELGGRGYEPAGDRVQTSANSWRPSRKHRPEVIISDHTVPGYGGLVAFADLKATGKDIPFILVSGTVGEGVAVSAMKAERRTMSSRETYAPPRGGRTRVARAGRPRGAGEDARAAHDLGAHGVCRDARRGRRARDQQPAGRCHGQPRVRRRFARRIPPDGPGRAVRQLPSIGTLGASTNRSRHARSAPAHPRHRPRREALLEAQEEKSGPVDVLVIDSSRPHGVERDPASRPPREGLWRHAARDRE